MAGRHTDSGLQHISYKEVNTDITGIMTRTGTGYYVLTACFAAAAGALFFLPWGYQIYVGQGVTGLNIPVLWGIYLVNFVFWVGIAHAGTLISAMLYITQTPWRRAISRGAETMTFFALGMVTLFIFMHMGRPWNVYWTLPYPNQRQIWTSFISPITFDVVAIGTYTTSSIVFLYFGLIPDLAALSHTTTGWRKKLYETLSIGWRGTDEQWHAQAKACMYFSSFIMPLVVSVHSVVSWDFALSVVPGFSKTIFAPYFVTGALLSGLAGVLLMLSIMREAYPVMKKYVTDYHYDSIAVLVLVLSLVWSYLTLMEVTTGLYANTSEEIEHLRFKLATPPYLYLFALMIFSNTVVPLLYIIKKVRPSVLGRFVVPVFILIGMWLERYLIIPNSLSRKFLPWMWHDYSPTWVEVSITAGAFLGFITLFMIFIKVFPIIAIFEVKEDIGVPMKGRH
ncbi:MAG: polysulfide reductase NrfD [Deltaproteobacteria bacterium]|nr:polysulfide reductase NrfD [Deltaproteobacteria bacterium]